MRQTLALPLARVPSAQRQPPPPGLRPFADPFQPDPGLEDFLHRASSLLCDWLGGAAAASPLPGLSVLPEVEPEAGGLGPERLLADLQLVMEGAYNPNHPGALAHLDPPPWRLRSWAT